MPPVNQEMINSERVITRSYRNSRIGDFLKELLRIKSREMTRDEIQSLLALRDRKSFRKAYIKPALADSLIEMTIPDKPNSRMQKYRLTLKGITLLNDLNVSDSG